MRTVMVVMAAGMLGIWGCSKGEGAPRAEPTAPMPAAANVQRTDVPAESGSMRTTYDIVTGDIITKVERTDKQAFEAAWKNGDARAKLDLLRELGMGGTHCVRLGETTEVVAYTPCQTVKDMGLLLRLLETARFDNESLYSTQCLVGFIIGSIAEEKDAEKSLNAVRGVLGAWVRLRKERAEDPQWSAWRDTHPEQLVGDGTALPDGLKKEWYELYCYERAFSKLLLTSKHP